MATLTETRFRWPTHDQVPGYGIVVGTRSRIEPAPCGSELRVKPNCTQFGPTTVAVVRGVRDSLVVESEAASRRGREVAVGLEDALRSGVRQPAVADEQAEATGIQEPLSRLRYSVDDRSGGEGIVRALPDNAAQRRSRDERTVDVGELV